MSSISKSTAAQEFIQAFSGISSTEDLILYVAGTDNMLSFCQDLIEQYDQDDLTLMTLEINSLCATRGVLPGLLYSEIRKVLIALNRFHNANQNHYATLGLKENAPINEVKKTYRQLSKHHHPDMVQNNDNDTQHFMEITGAYHAIMASLNDTKLPGHKPWRKKSNHLKTKHQRNRNRFLLTVIPLILVLAGISLYVTKIYNEKIVLSQIEASSQSGAYNVEPIKPAVNTVNTALPAKPPPENLFLQETADDKILTSTPSLPKSKQEEPLANSSKKEITSSPPPSQFDKTSETDQDTPSPVINEPNEPANQDTVEPSLSTNKSEELKPVEQADKIEDVEKNRNEQEVQPVQRIHLDKQRSHETQKQLEQDDLKLVIETILKEYSKSYCSKDLEHFLTLFNNNATENGQPQASLIDQYKSLFTRTRAIDLDFDDIKWKEFQDGFQATCTFKSNYTYNDGRAMEHTGNITFYLTDEQDGLKIQSLDYVFLN